MESMEDKSYISTAFKEIITIDSIVSLHYFEFANDYVFKGERHNFWEFLYVDKGEVEIMADTTGYKLELGDIVFHKPNEFHSVWANGRIAPNIVVISFVCNSNVMNYFDGKIMKLTSCQRDLLSSIVQEGKEAYSNCLEHNYTKLTCNNSPKLGCEQMVRLYLEMFLIQLVREDGSVKTKDRYSLKAKERVEEDIVNDIVKYMNENVNKNLSLDDICLNFFLGRTHLKTMFKSSLGKGVMSYFSDIKIDEAKKLIRQRRHNITEISEILGYDSVHYFSKCFKKRTNMSPTEYAISVKARSNI